MKEAIKALAQKLKTCNGSTDLYQYRCGIYDCIKILEQMKPEKGLFSLVEINKQILSALQDKDNLSIAETAWKDALEKWFEQNPY